MMAQTPPCPPFGLPSGPVLSTTCPSLIRHGNPERVFTRKTTASLHASIKNINKKGVLMQVLCLTSRSIQTRTSPRAGHYTVRRFPPGMTAMRSLAASTRVAIISRPSAALPHLPDVKTRSTPSLQRSVYRPNETSMPREIAK